MPENDQSTLNRPTGLEPETAHGPRETQADYERDVYSWALRQAELLRTGRVAEADLEHIAEELEGLGKSQRKSLESYVTRVLQHMLKWDYQPEKRSRSWANSIRVHRLHAMKQLRDNPGLKPELSTILDDSYPIAVAYAVEDTGLDDSDFPRECPYDWDEVVTRPFVFESGS